MLQGFVSDGDDHPILLVGHFPRRCDEAIRQISPVCPVIDAVRPSCQAMARRTPAILCLVFPDVFFPWVLCQTAALSIRTSWILCASTAE